MEVAFDFLADPADPEQMTIRTGDVVQILDDLGDGWVRVRRLQGGSDFEPDVGVVPASYLQARDPPVNQPSSPIQVQFSSEAPPAPAVETPSSSHDSGMVRDERLAKYERMRKASVPEGAIRNAMARDKVDAALVASFFASSGGGEGDDGGDSGGIDGMPKDADPALEKYYRMRQHGLPEGAIRNAMRRDGVDEARLFGGSSGASATPAMSIQEQIAAAKAKKSVATGFGGSGVASSPPVAAAVAPPKSSPMDLVKAKALERQRRMEENHVNPLTEFHKPEEHASHQETTPPWKRALKPVMGGGTKRTQSAQEDGEEETETMSSVSASAPPREKAARPCGAFTLDLGASTFQMCKCGWEKSAHRPDGAMATREEEDDVRDSRETRREVVVEKKKPAPPDDEQLPSPPVKPREPEPRPCANYSIDTAHPVFGTCKCGHPKSMHGQNPPEEENRAHEAQVPPPQASQHVKPRDEHPCDDFRIDPAHPVFGTCRCGWTKPDHHRLDRKEPTLRAKSHSGHEEAYVPDGKVCNNFHLDVTKAFGTCRCGFPKAAHGGGHEGKSAEETRSAVVAAPGPVVTSHPPLDTSILAAKPPLPSSSGVDVPVVVVAEATSATSTTTARPSLVREPSGRRRDPSKPRPRPPPPPPPPSKVSAIPVASSHPTLRAAPLPPGPDAALPGNGSGLRPAPAPPGAEIHALDHHHIQLRAAPAPPPALSSYAPPPRAAPLPPVAMPSPHPDVMGIGNNYYQAMPPGVFVPPGASLPPPPRAAPPPPQSNNPFD